MVTKAPKRDPEATRRRILDAALELIAESGFSAFGVNALATRAEADKVLIYRYFGGLDGVIAALAERPELWLGASMEAVPSGSYAEVMIAFLTSYMKALRSSPLVLKELAWELAENSPQARLMADARARAVRRWFVDARQKAGPSAPDVDAPAINAVLIGGVHHLVLSAVSIGFFAGMDLADDAAWPRIEAALGTIIKAVHPERPERLPLR
jgi:AcrR family transcriptional regulator